MNFLPTNHFRFVIQRLPNVTYYTQKAPVPSVSANEVKQPTPFKGVPLHGDEMVYGDLSLTFKVDEDMINYLEILNWIKGLTSPNDFREHANLLEGPGLYSDASIITMNSKGNPNVEIIYKNIWPKSLGEVQFDGTQSEVQYPECSVEFAIEGFTIRKI